MATKYNKDSIKEIIARYITLPEKKEKDPKDKENAEIYEAIFAKNKDTYSSILAQANELFLNIREIVTEFAQSHKNVMLLDLTDELKLPELNILITVYCYNPYRVAIMITNEIYSKLKHPLLTCRTLVEHEEFAIDIMSRTFVKIYSLAPGEQSKKSSYAIKSLKNDRFMPPEWEIINLLENAVYGEEEIAVENPDAYVEKRFSQAIERYQEHLDKVIGGRPSDQYYYPNAHIEMIGGREKSCRESSKSMLDQLKLTLMHDMFKSEDFIILGTWAHAAFKGNPCVNTDRIQVLYRKGPVELKNRIANAISKIGKFPVTMGKVFPIELPEEYRLKKVNIKVSLPSMGEMVLVEWLSVLDYSAVPVINANGWLIPVKPLLARYAFIDMFIIYNVFCNNNISKERYIQYQRKLLEVIQSKVSAEAEFIVGFHIPYMEYRKFYMLEGKKFQPYQPANGIKTV